jgi:HSP20 family protein
VKGNVPDFNWKSLQKQAGEVLGDDFWDDIANIIPNLGPRVDVYQMNQEVVVVIELPGLRSPNEIKVVLNGSVLAVKGEVERGYPVDEHKMIQSERFHGKFKREIPLPKNMTFSEINAKFKKGLLEIRLTKDQAQKDQDIAIEFTEHD